MKMSSEINIRDNSLNLVRLLASIQVVAIHIMSHFSINAPLLYEVLNIFRGVPVFFVISGFLIAASSDNTPSFTEFIKKRFKRIYPALWVGTAVSVFIMLFFVTVNLKEIILYIIGQCTFLQFWTPNSLRNYGVGTPNGSLWTIVVELQFYILIYFMYKKLKKSSLKTCLSTIVTCIILSIGFIYIKPHIPDVVYKLLLETVLPYLYMFLIGTFIYKYKEIILPFIVKHFNVLFVATVIFHFIPWKINAVYIDPISGVLIGVTAIAFAFKFKTIKIKNDISYGVYIYHMIFVNLVIALSINNLAIELAIVVLSTLLFAILSWKFIEEPILRRKK